jgi:hypothetical protein
MISPVKILTVLKGDRDNGGRFGLRRKEDYEQKSFFATENVSRTYIREAIYERPLQCEVMILSVLCVDSIVHRPLLSYSLFVD